MKMSESITMSDYIKKIEKENQDLKLELARTKMVPSSGIGAKPAELPKPPDHLTGANVKKA